MAKLDSKSGSSSDDERMAVDIDYYVMAVSALVKLSAVRHRIHIFTFVYSATLKPSNSYLTHFKGCCKIITLFSLHVKAEFNIFFLHSCFSASSS